MRWPLLLLGLLIAMAAAVAAAMVIGEPPGARGVADARFATMLDGDPGAERHGRVLVVGWILGVLVTGFSAALLAWGYRRKRWASWSILAVFATQVAAFSALMVSYAGFIDEPSPGLWGALPAPSAWLVYLFWPSQFGFVILYVATFDRWFWTPADDARFGAILRGEGEAGGP